MIANLDSKWWKGREQAALKISALYADPTSSIRNIQKIPCTKCGQMMPPRILAMHFEVCQGSATLSYNDNITTMFEGKLPQKANDVIIATGTQT